MLRTGVSYLDNGVTYVPLRGLLDAFGGWSVWWDSGERTAEAASDSHRVSADPAADTVTVDGRAYRGEVFVERGRTYVPLRTTVTALGGGVAWDPYLGGAAVTSPGGGARRGGPLLAQPHHQRREPGRGHGRPDRRGQRGAQPGGGGGVPRHHPRCDL